MARKSNAGRLLRRMWAALPTAVRESPAGHLLRAGYHSPAGRLLSACVRFPQTIRNHLAFPGRAFGIPIPHLEIHITHKCNLTCEGCLHFTNHRHSGMLSLDELRRSMALWNKRLLPKRFAILGGEPCLHRELVDIVRMTGEMWPHPGTEKEVVTNGLLLHLHPGLPRALVETDTSLTISMHSDGSISPKYQEKFSRGLDLARKWESEHGIELTVDDSLHGWSMGYRGFGSEIMPFEDADPRKSWDNCVTGQECFQLFEDQLWKCAPAAYLQLQDRKFSLSDKWKPYLKYRPLSPECSDREIAEFFKRKSEPVCGMCPGNPQKFIKRDPLLPVRFYKAPAAGRADVDVRPQCAE